MSNQESGTRLDANALDPIIKELALGEADALDRLQIWYKDLLRSFWNWLEKLTGGEEGWLSQLSDWVSDQFKGLSGAEPIEAEPILNLISWGSGLLVIGLAGYLCYRFWRLYQETRIVDPSVQFTQRHANLVRDWSELAPQQKAGALFVQACLKLAERGLVDLSPHATNRQLADKAQLASPHHKSLQNLADAADKALFGGWHPDSSDLENLSAMQSKLLAELEVQQ